MELAAVRIEDERASRLAGGPNPFRGVAVASPATWEEASAAAFLARPPPPQSKYLAEIMRAESIEIDGVAHPLTRDNALRLLRYHPSREVRQRVYQAYVCQHAGLANVIPADMRARFRPGRSLVANPRRFLLDYAGRLAGQIQAEGVADPADWTYFGDKMGGVSAETGRAYVLGRIAAAFNIVFRQDGANSWRIDQTRRTLRLELATGVPEIPYCLYASDVIVIRADWPDQWGHDEISTLFHECGHAIHFAFNRCVSMAAVDAIEDDFGEIPGVLFEQFGRDPRTWADLGMSPPPSLYYTGVGRQVAIGLFDTLVCEGEAATAANITAWRHWIGGQCPPGPWWASFEHFATNYVGRYYMYGLAYAVSDLLWPKVLADPAGWLRVCGDVGRRPARDALCAYLPELSALFGD